MITLHKLPVEILVNILAYLPSKDIRSLICTCKTLQNLILNENAVWRSIFRDKLVIHAKKNSVTTLSCYNKYRISHNWCKGVYKSTRLIFHRAKYMPWLSFHKSESLLLTVGSELFCYGINRYGFPDCNKVYWQLNMPKVDRCDVRTNDISRFLYRDKLLVCGNRDGSAAVYKLNKITMKPYLIQYIKDCHEQGLVEVSAVNIVNNTNSSYMVTGSNDSKILLFWRWYTGNDCTDLGEGGDSIKSTALNLINCYGVKSLAVNNHGDKVAVGPNGNNKPLLVDANTAKIVASFEDSEKVHRTVRDIQWHDENTVCYVTHSGLLQLMDTRSHRVVYAVIDPFNSKLYCLKTDNDNAIVAGSSEYSRCVLFDRRYSHHIQMYFTQKKSSPVYSLDFDSTKLIAAVDQVVTALNFNVNTATTQQRDYSHTFFAIPNSLPH